MDAVQDDDYLWRRAFADSSGLFDNLSYGPLLGLADHTAAAQSHDIPIPVLVADAANNIEPTPTTPAPAPSFITTPSAKQVLLPCPSVAPSPVAPRQVVAQTPAVSTTSTSDWPSSNGVTPGSIPHATKPSSAAASAAAAILAVAEPEDYQVSSDMIMDFHGLVVVSAVLQCCTISTPSRGTIWRPRFCERPEMHAKPACSLSRYFSS